MNGTENNHHTYLGQEMNKELGLNWLTFRYRNYMPEIGRFFGVDPVSEDYMSISTYQFAHNNPVWKIEIEGLEGASTNKPDQINKESIKRTITVLGQPTFTQDNRTAAQRAQDKKEIPRKNREYRERERQKTLGPPSQRVGADRSKFIMTGVAYGMADVMTGAVIGKIFQGAKLLKTIASSKKASNTIVVMGQGMDRVNDAKTALLKNGVAKVEIFQPSAKAMKEWNGLLKGLEKGKHLSDDVVKGTKLFKENVKWINNANKSGKTILDIGNSGSKAKSTFYEMEKSVIYGNK